MPWAASALTVVAFHDPVDCRQPSAWSQPSSIAARSACVAVNAQPGSRLPAAPGRSRAVGFDEFCDEMWNLTTVRSCAGVACRLPRRVIAAANSGFAWRRR